MNATPENQKALILNAVSGPIELPRVSRMYLLGLFLTAGAVLLLPLLYLGLIGMVLGGLFTLIRFSNSIFAGWPPVIKWLTVTGATAFGIAFIVGLLKPMVARSTAIRRPAMLRRDAEPFLFAYVDRLCDALGAPRATQIHVTLDINAAAELSTNRAIFFGPSKVSLHIGLPLVAGLTLAQFTGVLAHELGHFTQRTAMWFENTVRRINQWYLRAACERDSVDEWIDRGCASASLSAIPWLMTRMMVWLTRRVLLGLALAGTAISCLMSREMEFNADRCQVRTVGLKTLAATLKRLRELTLAHQTSFRDVAAFYAEGRLPEDMIALAVANMSLITPKVKKKLRQMMLDEQTRAFDSHPSDLDRIQAGASDPSPGVFHEGSLAENVPAAILFSRFDEICAIATTRYYEAALQQQITPRMLHPVDNLLDRQNAEMDATRALRRYFQTDIPRLRPLPLAHQSTDPPENRDAVMSELKTCRERMMNELLTYKRLAGRYRAAEETLYETVAAQTLLQARLTFNPEDFHLASADAGTAADKQARAREGVTNLATKMLPFETEAGNRLSFALQLLHDENLLQQIPWGDELLYEIGDMLPAAQLVGRLIGELPKIRIIVCRLLTLRERSDGKSASPRMAELRKSQLETLRARLVSMQAELSDHLYPFDHARAQTTLREFVLPAIPLPHDEEGLLGATELMQSRLMMLQLRLFARLAQAAEKIEAAIGMPPLPEPGNDDDD